MWNFSFHSSEAELLIYIKIYFSVLQKVCFVHLLILVKKPKADGEMSSKMKSLMDDFGDDDSEEDIPKINNKEGGNICPVSV